MKRAKSEMQSERVIVALLKYRTYTEAAKALGVSRVTIWRYLQDPDFRRRFWLAQAHVSSAAQARLAAQADGAADLLMKIIHNPKESTADRFRVAKYILDQPFRLSLDDVQMEDFEQDAPSLDPEITTGVPFGGSSPYQRTAGEKTRIGLAGASSSSAGPC